MNAINTPARAATEGTAASAASQTIAAPAASAATGTAFATAPSASLLIELFTEELPPKALKTLGQVFAQTISQALQTAGLVSADAAVTPYASPRRLAVVIDAVAARAADRPQREKLLPVSVGFNTQGEPQPPLIKKLASLGLTLGENLPASSLIRQTDGKAEALFVDITIAGADIVSAAQDALTQAIAALPIPKVMRYQWPDKASDSSLLQEVKFVRPAHRLVALHGDTVLPLTALGLKADRITEGHRFMAKGPITIARASNYADQLLHEGFVIAHFEKRKRTMIEGLKAAAQGATVVMPDALLDEVASLVEWPVVLSAGFDASFLKVPQECLILTMQQNQKYFALTDTNNTLVNRFLLVSNLASKDPSVVIQGNERVLRARLSDAQFFFTQDQKRPLAQRVDSLAQVVYHNKIGSQAQRIARITRLAQKWAPWVGADPAKAQRAAELAKADLATDMVGEFPELQGIAGQYYARHDGEDPEVCQAIEGHYHPRFAGDSLPSNSVGLAVALADKLESLVGIWGIGLVPSGDKDPFALRRAALGISRILIESRVPAPLGDLLRDTAQSFAEVPAVTPRHTEIQSFIADRVRGYLKDKGFNPEAIEGVLAQCPDRYDQLIDRLQAIEAFLGSAQAPALCAAHKRIGNILKKSEQHVNAEVSAELLREPAEKSLAQALAERAPLARALVNKGSYTEAMQGLAALKEPVDAFFEQVMVNAEDPALRSNRLALLQNLFNTMNLVADLSRLAKA
nr:Glycine--tRNA ligase beta subunit [Cupriavidus sp.]